MAGYHRIQQIASIRGFALDCEGGQILVLISGLMDIFVINICMDYFVGIVHTRWRPTDGIWNFNTCKILSNDHSLQTFITHNSMNK